MLRAIGINNLHATKKTYVPLARSASGVSDTPSPLHSRGTTSSVGSKSRFLHLFFKIAYLLPGEQLLATCPSEMIRKIWERREWVLDLVCSIERQKINRMGNRKHLWRVFKKLETILGQTIFFACMYNKACVDKNKCRKVYTKNTKNVSMFVLFGKTSSSFKKLCSYLKKTKDFPHFYTQKMQEKGRNTYIYKRKSAFPIIFCDIHGWLILVMHVLWYRILCFQTQISFACHRFF